MKAWIITLSAMSVMSQPSTSPTARSRKKIGEPTEIEPIRFDFNRNLRPGTLASSKRRVLLSLECGLFLAPARRRQNADVRTRQKSVEAGDVAGEETRLDDPERRSFGEQRRRLRVCRDGDEDVRIIGRQPQALDRPKLDILELERRLAGLQTLGAVECDLSGRGAGYPAPPPQIPACGLPAPGSCRRSNVIDFRGLGRPI